MYLTLFRKVKAALIQQAVLISIFSFLLITSVLPAQTVYRQIGGPWNDPNSWADGIVPPDALENGDAILIEGAAILDGMEVDQLDIAAGSSLNILNTGSLTVSGAPILNAGFFDNAGVFSSKSANFTNRGTLNNRNGASFTFGDMEAQVLTNNGVINILEGGTMTINGATFDQLGEFEINGAFTNNGVLNNETGGQINILSGGTFNLGVEDVSTGSLTSGGLITNNGAFNFSNGSSFSQQGKDGPGSLNGGGTFNGDLSITGGTIAPGNSFGTMVINGDYTVFGGVTHVIEIGGDGGNDLIQVTGTANIAGNLNLIFGPGFFNNGETWDVVDAGILNGAFNTPPIYTLPNGIDPTSTLGAVSDLTNDVVTVTYLGQEFLPIELIRFTAVLEDNVIALEWATASETNNHYMMVERSADGIQFDHIGRVYGAGTTVEAQHYTFIDEQPAPGWNYYRLRQVDYDRSEEYSKVVAIDASGIQQEGLHLEVYPNPAADRIQVSWKSASVDEHARIRILDYAGRRELASYALPEGTQQMNMPLEALPSGHYIIQLVHGKQVKAVKLVKR